MTHKNPPPDPVTLFDSDMAAAYDRRNSGLAPISNCLHFLTRLVLADLPETARVLCIGVGTGAEILSLASARQGWSFVGVDPAPKMLAVCRTRLAEAGILDRCQLVEGYVDAIDDGGFDVAITLLVAHFIKLSDRPGFYRAIYDRLKPGGRFVSAEISCDLNAGSFPAMLENWEQVQALMGATPASLEALPDVLRDQLGVVSPATTETLWREAGFTPPIDFFQAFLIRGWHARRPDPIAP